MDREQVKAIFDEALRKEGAEREAVLDRLCNDDAALRSEVEGLIEAFERAGRFLKATPDENEEGPGSTIGRYKLLQEIGEGGFGVVYMAEQTEPVHRRVALKVIKLGMDTKQVIARFEAERQALALMDHPNIAKVLDAGATATGRPYFVMELVKGVPITEYCDQARLDTSERLALIQKVCYAVQHAHQKGIIHRDIKPNNVLVTLHDGRPVPKVIDFGIAKATDHSLTEKTLFTEFRQMIGTPEYMAPEQAEMSGLDIDTRADIYSLGVLTYELLTGTKPFDLNALLASGYEEILRTIREVDPPKPSTRLSTMGDLLTAVAEQRHTAPALLGKLLRGDLDWIVMRSLEKDRTRRYETPTALARDIQRFLEDEPVRAGPPSAAYRASKYFRRNRVAIVVASVVFAGMLLGGGLAFAGMREANLQAEAEERARTDATRQAGAAREAQAAEKEQRARAEKGAAEAETESTRANAVVGFISSMLWSADPFAAKGRNYTVRQILDDFDRDFGTRLKAHPEVEASVRMTMGIAYLNLGLLDKAEPHLKKALTILDRPEHRGDPALVDGLYWWAILLDERGEIAASIPFRRRVVAARRRAGDDPVALSASLTALGSALTSRDELDAAEQALREAVDVHRGGPSLMSLASLLRTRGQYDAAEKLLAEALDAARRNHGAEHPDVARIMCEQAWLFREKGELDKAEAIAEQALALQEKVLGQDHYALGLSLNELALVRTARGNLAGAEESLRRSLAIDRKALGEEHHLVATGLHNLARIRRIRLDFKGAERLQRESLAIHRKVFGEESESIATDLDHVGIDLLAQGDNEGAERAHRKALAIYTKLFGDRHRHVALCLGNLARAVAPRDPAESERMLLKALSIKREVLGNGHTSVATTLRDLAFSARKRGDLPAAENLIRQALDIVRAKLGAAHGDVATMTAGLAQLEAAQGRFETAEKHYREALGIWVRAYGEDYPGVIACRRLLAVMLLETKDYAGAEACVRKLIAVQRSDGLLAFLGLCLMEQDKHAEAEPIARECLAIRAKKMPGHWLHYNAMSLVGGALAGQGKYAEAEPLLVEGYEKMQPPEANAARKRQALERVISLYTAWGKPDKAKQWEARR